MGKNKKQCPQSFFTSFVQNNFLKVQEPHLNKKLKLQKQNIECGGHFCFSYFKIPEFIY